ncbi:hypothetical protein [Catalinimonas alkaloidigena]|uniref:hypothetical protein n=1 Tax=Catalinimonas alkaloidigena TaxID=1075417 RepID=UPI001C409AD1|nr:hypothetical protein [Catalinimonas alkaloidigena]
MSLLYLYVGVCVSLGLRLFVESSHFLSPDSEYYLSCSQNVLDGKGFVLDNPQTGQQIPFTVWPVGYPALIALVAWLTGLPVLWSSKLINLLLLAVAFGWLRQLAPARAWWLALAFTSATLLEVFSFTWSEAPFLIVLLVFGGALHRYCAGPGGWPRALGLLGLGSALFLLRYIGAFAFLCTAGAALLVWTRPAQFRYRALPLLVVSLVGMIVVVGYLSILYMQTGFWTGGARFVPAQESLGTFGTMLFKALVGEWVIPYAYYPAMLAKPSFWRVAFVQVGLFGWGFYRVRRLASRTRITLPAFAWVLVGISVLYLVALVGLRWLSPFDAFGPRLLAPATLLLLVAGLYTIACHEPLYRNLRLPLVLLFLLSLFLNTPKSWVLQWWQTLLS